MIAMAPRLDTLEGKTICEVANGSFRSDVIIPLLGDLLKKSYPGIKVVRYTEMPRSFVLGKASEAQLETMKAAFRQKGCDAVISGNGG
jgi:hypothetical protein